MDPGAFGAPVGILYNVTWFPNTPEALQKVPEVDVLLLVVVPVLLPGSNGLSVEDNDVEEGI